MGSAPLRPVVDVPSGGADDSLTGRRDIVRSRSRQSRWSWWLATHDSLRFDAGGTTVGFIDLAQTRYRSARPSWRGVGFGRGGGDAGDHVRRIRRVVVVRRGVDRLLVRDHLHGVRGDLPLQRVGAAPVDGDVEPARLGRVPSAQDPQRGRAAVAGRHAAFGTGLHPATVTGPLVGASAGVLGVHPGWAGDLSVDDGFVALRKRRPAGRPLPGVRIAGRGDVLRC